MRLTVFICFVFSMVAMGNPLWVALPAADRIYMSSEQLTANISPAVAELKGRFTFKYRPDVPAPGQKSFVMLEIPIWFPEMESADPTEFWKVFPKDEVNEVTPVTMKVFMEAVGLRAHLGD